MDIKRKVIDWKQTGINLKLLRCDNLELRKYVCRHLSLSLTKGHICKAVNCDNCTDMDTQISQSELAVVMNVSDYMIANWETNRTVPTLEDLLMYCDICQLDLLDIIVFQQ